MNEALMERKRGSFSESTLIIVKREARTNVPSVTNVAKKMLKEYKGGGIIARRETVTAQLTLEGWTVER